MKRNETRARRQVSVSEFLVYFFPLIIITSVRAACQLPHSNVGRPRRAREYLHGRVRLSE